MNAIVDGRCTRIVDGGGVAVADKDECVHRRKSARSGRHAQIIYFY